MEKAKHFKFKFSAIDSKKVSFRKIYVYLNPILKDEISIVVKRDLITVVDKVCKISSIKTNNNILINIVQPHLFKNHIEGILKFINSDQV